MTLVNTEECLLSNNPREKTEENLTRHLRAPFGYRMNDGKYVIVPGQAETVKNIFDLVLAGNGTLYVAKELNRREITTGKIKRDGTPGSWSSSMVQRILSNVFYSGDLLQNQKHLATDYAGNPDDEALKPFLIRNHHEGIVDRETFCLANTINRQLGKKRHIQSKENPNDGNNALTGKLCCGICGASMKRVRQKVGSGVFFYWACTGRLRDINVCPMKRIREETVENSFVTLANKLCYLRDEEEPDDIFAGFHPLEDFDEKLFRDNVVSADVITNEAIVFYLKCGLKLTERFTPKKGFKTDMKQLFT